MRKTCGSAPRLRGTLDPKIHRVTRERFSPAPAGNTVAGPARKDTKAVQPRACGEHQSSVVYNAWYGGSAPRLRGTRLLRRPADRRHRFSPAPAGNTASAAPTGVVMPVQPRACGEHITGGSGSFGRAGSAPRLRGTLPEPIQLGGRHRFSPAPAGNTFVSFAHGRPLTVQPRACGEHSGLDYLRASYRGSAPRLRGTRS